MSVRHGSDAIVSHLIEAGIEQVAFNPGASFRGIHDSLVHTPGAPAISLCMHEMVAVSMAQGYAKAAGTPMAALLHNVVGLQNASMAIYNAWCDRVPLLLLGGTGPKSKANRRPWIDWIHTASVQANIVRDFVKWDDEPHDIASVAESFARGLTATKALPSGPVYLCYDVDLQEDPLPAGFVEQSIAQYAVPSPPAPAPADVDWLVERLRAARRPLILAGYVGESPAQFAALTALAEALGAPVVDTGVRHAFPSGHRLNGAGVPGLVEEADAILALDVEELHGPLGARLAATTTASASGAADAVAAPLTLLNVTLSTLKLRAWAHDYQPLAPAERQITASADLVVEALLQRLKADPLDAATVNARGDAAAARIASARAGWSSAAKNATADGVVPLERLIHELGGALRDVPFVLGGGTNGRLEQRQWALDRARQYAGWASGGGLGYGVSGALGVALAQEPGTITVDLQADGDLLFLPSALWTAAHKRLPVLIVVNDNRQYGNTVEHAQKIGRLRGHGDGSRYAGAGLADPPVDLAAMARSFGLWAAGPVSDPETLATTLQEAVAVVRSGRPALVDVLTPGF
ncbi:thiamine pyrophosphate-binding protein [Conexibacter sp. JD483]|uniref:thiamine pyrophosphate-dependent enzyme n=1 Tax=unclassified Conexibacter TaxID=2627773 RepID=UPI002720B0B9|nr:MULTISPECIES: thiamine pyrophosphate-dependent enzyme [unclassified Conexibacter]MDO8185999.1 thiamine pyrophosphate-binding protein [Conexibacter sp. CPCC 205706]MDO8199489.1 thiamine pyrophosphate-binding protein [Conexibacter sp. CPCC 205762]MDR9368976.1 thiamine pyrophosphate-binding protein [Conexibacter sp. JD483]